MRKLWLLLPILGALFFSSTMSLGQDAEIQMSVDAPSTGTAVFQNFNVVGWAFDRTADIGYGPGIDRIEIYEGPVCQGDVLAQGIATLSRPSVADTFSLDESFELIGYNIPVEVDQTGLFTITVCAFSSVNEGVFSQITYDLQIMPPGMLLSVENLYDSGPIVENTVISGWAVDTRAGEGQGPGVDDIRVVLGETCQGDVLAQTTPNAAKPIEIGSLNLDASYQNGGFEILLDGLSVGVETLTICASSSVDQTVQSETFSLTVYASETLPLWPLAIVILASFSLLYLLVKATSRHLGDTSIWSRPWFIVLFIALSLIPAIIVMAYLYRYAFNLPAWDEWIQTVDAYTKSLSNGIDFSLLWRLKNEHRTFVPQFMGLIIAHLTSANVLVLVFLNVVIVIMIWTLVYTIYRHHSESAKHYFILLPAALLLFAMVIWPRWVDSRPFRLSSAILYFIVSLWIITVGKRNLRTLFFASIFAALSSLSFFTGNYTWIIVGGMMPFLRYFKIRYYVLWIVMAAIVLVPYMVDFANSNTIARHAASPSIEQLAEFVMFFVGSPLAPYLISGSQTEPVLLGAIGLGATAFLSTYNLLLVRKGFLKSLPWIAIIGWVLLNAVTAGYGRISQFGVIVASANRYMIYGLLFWTSLFALISIALFEPKQALIEGWKRQAYRLRYVVNTALITLMVFLSFCYVGAYQSTLQQQNFLQYVTRLRSASGCMYDFMNAPDSCLADVHPVPETLREIAYEASQSRVSWLEVDTYPLAVQYANDPQPDETSVTSDDRTYDAFSQPPEDAASWTIYIPNGVQTMLHTTLILPVVDTEDLQYSIVASANENQVELPLNVSSESDANHSHHRVEADLTPFAGQEITLSFIVSSLHRDEIIWVVPTIQYVDSLSAE